MKKMRALCAAVLGFSLLLGNIGYAAEVVETVEPSEIILPEEPDSASLHGRLSLQISLF